MKTEYITAKDNQFVKRVVKLQSSARFRRESGMFVCEGLRLCNDAALSNIRFSALAVSDSALKKYPNDISVLESNSEMVYYVNDTVFSKMCDTATPQGVIGVVRIDDIISRPFDKNGKYIALENIQDPANLGAVSRTAEAFGVTGLVLSNDGCDPFSPKALRASMGALFRIPLFLTDNLTGFFVSHNIVTYACVVDSDAKQVGDIVFENGCAALIGNEGNGLKDETKRSCNQRITIPMSGRAESLNAAVAASIIIWEMQRH